MRVAVRPGGVTLVHRAGVALRHHLMEAPFQVEK